jgi:cyclase
VHIFNDKEVDELIILDIDATQEKRIPDLRLIQKIADECYMPFTVGGGISSVEQAGNIIKSGAEKIAVCTAALINPDLVRQIAEVHGSQSLVVSVDVKKDLFGKYRVVMRNASKKASVPLFEWLNQLEQLGAGEILINSIDRDGMMKGYDLHMIKKVAERVSLPIIALGGAAEQEDLKKAIDYGADAVAAGSMFVFKGLYRAVLINYPNRSEIENLFK